MPVEITLHENQIKNLLQEYGSPLQIYDGNLIKENLINFLKIMTNRFKNFKQYFAVKALPNPNILKLLVDNGSFLDCSSLTELKLAEMIGVIGEKIMFTSNYTSKEDLIYAKHLNAIINLDDISLIEDLKSIGMPHILSFRLNPGIGKTDSETLSNVNDIFIIYDTGAHSHSMGFQYNGKLRAPEILILNNEYKLIRRKEVYEDYISTVLF